VSVVQLLDTGLAMKREHGYLKSMGWNIVVKLHTRITIRKHFSWPPPCYLIPRKNISTKKCLYFLKIY